MSQNDRKAQIYRLSCRRVSIRCREEICPMEKKQSRGGCFVTKLRTCRRVGVQRYRGLVNLGPAYLLEVIT
jgi:hypothetical protein